MRGGGGRAIDRPYAEGGCVLASGSWPVQDVEFVVKEDGSFAIWAKEEDTDGKRAKDWRFLASITT